MRSFERKLTVTRSKAYRLYLTGLVCLAMFFCNFLVAGPAIALVEITIDFFGPPGQTYASAMAFESNIAKTAYFITSAPFAQGVGMLFWMPVIVKYGRRPVYLLSYVLYFGATLWCAFAKTYNVELAGRIVLGLAAGAGECLGPLTIADLWFAHERSTYMALYTMALSLGVASGTLLDGLITIHLSWRYIYYITSALVGALLLLVFFTFPETTFKRTEHMGTTQAYVGSTDEKSYGMGENEGSLEQGGPRPAKASYVSSLRIFTGTYTSESFFTIFIRPLVLVLLPPVLWASAVMAVTIGFLIAISTNIATAFQTVYGFAAWQSGLCFLSGIIGTLMGIAFAGHISDWTADYFTRKNGGRREPEMRLPSLIVGGIFAPLGILLYGVGLAYHYHWIVSTLGLGFLSFAIVQTTNVTLVYTIDAYRPAAGEVAVSQLAFKGTYS